MIEALERWEASHGTASEELAECPVVWNWLKWIWDAFLELSSSRAYGPSSICHADILAYCVLHGVKDVKELCFHVLRMDRVWAKWVSFQREE